MSLRAALLAGLLLLAGLAVAGVLRMAYTAGRDAGIAAVRSEWDETIRAANKARDAARDEAYGLSATYEAKLRQLEARNERARKQQQASPPVQCPASGLLDDVVVPAVVIDSMFHYDEAR
jgi:hypothetical protein